MTFSMTRSRFLSHVNAETSNGGQGGKRATHQQHQHEGPHVDGQEEQRDHGQREDPPDPPVFPPAMKTFSRLGFHGLGKLSVGLQ